MSDLNYSVGKSNFFDDGLQNYLVTFWQRQNCSMKIQRAVKKKITKPPANTDNSLALKMTFIHKAKNSNEV